MKIDLVSKKINFVLNEEKSKKTFYEPATAGNGGKLSEAIAVSITALTGSVCSCRVASQIPSLGCDFLSCSHSRLKRLDRLYWLLRGILTATALGTRIALTNIVTQSSFFQSIDGKTSWADNLEAERRRENKVGRKYDFLRFCFGCCCYINLWIEKHSTSVKVKDERWGDAFRLARNIYAVKCEVACSRNSDRLRSSGIVSGFQTELEVTGGISAGNITFQYNGKGNFPRTGNFCQEKVSVAVTWLWTVVFKTASVAKVVVAGLAGTPCDIGHNTGKLGVISSVFVGQTGNRKSIDGYIPSS